MYNSCATSAAAPDRPTAPSSSLPLTYRANVALPVRGIVVDRAELARWNAAGYSVTWTMPTGTPMVDVPDMGHYVFGHTLAPITTATPYWPPPPQPPFSNPSASASAYPTLPQPLPDPSPPPPPPPPANSSVNSPLPHVSPSLLSHSQGQLPAPDCSSPHFDSRSGASPSPILSATDTYLDACETELKAILSEDDTKSENIDVDARGTSDISADEACDVEQDKLQEQEDEDEEQLSEYEDEYFVPPTPPERTWSAGPPACEVPQTRRRWSAPRLPAFTMVGIVVVDDDDRVEDNAVDRVDMVFPSTVSLTTGSPVDKNLDKAQEIAHNGYYEVLEVDDPEVEPEQQKDSQFAMGENDDQETGEQQKEKTVTLKKNNEGKKSVKRKQKVEESQESTPGNKGGYSHTWSSLPPDSRTFALARAPDVLKQPEETRPSSPGDNNGNDEDGIDPGQDVQVTGIDWDKRILVATVHNKSLQLQLERKKENSANMRQKVDEMKLARANTAKASKQETSKKLNRSQKRALKRREEKTGKKAEEAHKGSANVAPNSGVELEEEKRDTAKSSRSGQPAQRVGGMRMNTKRPRPKSKPQKHVETLEGADGMEPRSGTERKVAYKLIADGIRNVSAEDRLPSADEQEMVRDTDDEADPVRTPDESEAE